MDGGTEELDRASWPFVASSRGSREGEERRERAKQGLGVGYGGVRGIKPEWGSIYRDGCPCPAARDCPTGVDKGRKWVRVIGKSVWFLSGVGASGSTDGVCSAGHSDYNMRVTVGVHTTGIPKFYYLK
jgi:hypothetical protein